MEKKPEVGILDGGKKRRLRCKVRAGLRKLLWLDVV